MTTAMPTGLPVGSAELRPLPSFSWLSLPGEMKDVSCASANQIFGIAQNNKIYKCDPAAGHAWIQMTGEGIDIDIGVDGTICAVTPQGTVFKWVGGQNWTTPLWQEQHCPPAQRIAVGSAQHICVLSDTNIYVMTPCGCRQLTGIHAQDVAVDEAGIVYAVSLEGDLFRASTTSPIWQAIPGAKLIHVDCKKSPLVIGISPAKQLQWYLGNGKWQTLPSEDCLDATVGKDGTICYVTAAGKVYAFHTTLDSAPAMEATAQPVGAHQGQLAGMGVVHPPSSTSASTSSSASSSSGACIATEKSFWRDRYVRDALAGELPRQPSSFAVFVQERFLAGAPHKMLELGCGNGRDARFFAHCGHKVTATDAAIETRDEAGVHFVTADATKLDPALFEGVTIVYARFFLHALNQADEDTVVAEFAENAAKGAMFVVEVRSTKDPLMQQGRTLSATERITDHYRRFVQFDDFVNRLRQRGLEMVYAAELAGVARWRDDDPVVVRVVACKG